MEENKLTDEEIVKVLECCTERCLCCDECPLREDSWCSNKVLPMGIDLIKRLQAENERLTEEANEETIKFIDICTENLLLRKNNRELQKQVDELTDKLGKVKELQNG
jgi:hypothetical protein